MISVEGCWLSDARALRGWCVDDNTLWLWHRGRLWRWGGGERGEIWRQAVQVVELLSSNLEVEKTYLGEPVQGEELLFTCLDYQDNFRRDVTVDFGSRRNALDSDQ